MACFLKNEGERNLSCTFTKEQYIKGLNEYIDVEPGRKITNIEKVIRQFHSGLILVRCVTVGNLSPTRYPGAYCVSKGVVWNALTKLLYKGMLLRPWADDTHFASENVPELGDFVDSCPTN